MPVRTRSGRLLLTVHLIGLLLALVMNLSHGESQVISEEKQKEAIVTSHEESAHRDRAGPPVQAHVNRRGPKENKALKEETSGGGSIPAEEDRKMEEEKEPKSMPETASVPSKSPPPPSQKTIIDIFRIAGKRALGGGIPGALAGMMQVVTLMWLRTVGNYQYRYGTSFTEAVATLYKQGGVGRFYEGLGFALIQGPLSRFGSTAANDGCRALLKNFEATRGLPLFVPTAMAALAAGSWRIFLMPIDTAKTVLQVEGNEGYRSLMRRIARGELSAFYQGSLATAAAAALGHFPWFYVYTLLNEAIRAPAGGLGKLCRNAFIGFVASLVADTLTNVMRVVKTTKQATASLSSISYAQTVQIILAADGWHGLLGRGLSTRILTNGLQSIVFTVVWRALSESAFFQSMIESQYEDDDDGAGEDSEASDGAERAHGVQESSQRKTGKAPS